MDSSTISGGITKRESGFKNKHHDQSTKNRISQAQKARYAYMNQMMKQHEQEHKQAFGPIDIDSPSFAQRIKEIVSEILNEEVKKAIPIRQNIPLY